MSGLRVELLQVSPRSAPGGAIIHGKILPASKFNAVWIFQFKNPIARLSGQRCETLRIETRLPCPAGSTV